ncbi:hypothetical protein N8987_03470, partial [Crocinitomix sp.]|nr:hypothetical protein [Crocinitomix sp.]
TPFHGVTNAICWTRKLAGDFSEIVKKVSLNENIMTLEPEELLELELSEQGQLAREIILEDLKVGISLTRLLNPIKTICSVCLCIPIFFVDLCDLLFF